MADISKLMETLSPEKSKLLELQLRKKGSLSNAFPLSFAQQRLWFLQQLQPDSTAYNIPAAIRLKGMLNIDIFEKALNEVVARHESLRTTFSLVNETPVQVIGAKSSLSLNMVDLSNFSAEQKASLLHQNIDEESKTVFDLTKGPLIRITLFSLNPDEHIFLLVMHHIVSDGWSVNIFMNEFTEIYSALSEKRVPVLPKLQIQYADFAQWQKSWLRGENRKKLLAYWKDQLGINTPVLELPTDHSRPATPAYRGALARITIPNSVIDPARALAHQEGTTFFMLMMALFNALLFRYTGQTDICIGSPIANRNREETENLIGFFVNTLVFRTRFAASWGFRQLLQKVKEVSLGAFTNQDLPFEVVVEELKPDRSLSHSPLFQVMMVHQNLPPEESDLPGLKIQPFEIENKTAKFDLTLIISERKDGGISATLEYDAVLFNPETARRILNHFKMLLQNVVAEPHRQIHSVPMLSKNELNILLREWNGLQTGYGSGQCIHSLFEDQVSKRPQAIALSYDNQNITYHELNQQANKLARYLRRVGVGPEHIVGIHVERSVEMIVGILAILKAGGAYLPLDPNYPMQRRLYMVEDSGLSIMLTTHASMKSMPNHSCRIIRIDSDASKFEGEDDQNLALDISPRNLAYIIYTSGSTGKPKGTLMEHHGIGNLIDNMKRDFCVSGSSRILQFASFSFDASVAEIFLALLSGATLVLADRETLLSVDALVRLLNEQSIAQVVLPPSLLAILPDTDLSRLKTVVSAGESCSWEVARRWSENHLFLNGYGPTETSVGCCWATVIDDSPPAASAPIGRAIDNVQIYLLDSHSNLVPIGAHGEICIGGIGLGRGYLNRPDLTADKFTPNPFGKDSGERLYRTGDLARYLPNGELEFIGRIDHQVKIRGFRVELGEIDSVIRQHPQVEDVVVALPENQPGNKILTAYIVLHEQENLDVDEIREFCRVRLPEYMVPSALVVLKDLPLLPNGKVDRKSLPAPDASSRISDHNYLPPQNSTEEIISNIMAQLLNIDRVGRIDNFFDMGGHSLLATQLVTRLKNSFKIDLPLKSLFEHPTVEKLAEVIEGAQRGEQRHRFEPIKTVSRERQIPLSLQQKRLWFLDQMEPGGPFYNIPAAFSIAGDLDIQILEASLNKMIRRHEVFRTTISTLDGNPFQVISDFKSAPLPVIDLSHFEPVKRQSEIHKLCEAEALGAFSLEKGPLFRCKLLKVDEKEHIILFTVHHIISDGWSMGIFIRELSAIYEARLKNAEDILPPLPVQYADFAVWQNNWLQSDLYRDQLNYWKKKLLGGPDLLNLPMDHPRPSNQTYHGKHIAFRIPQEVANGLKNISRQEGATLFMTLLAAFKTMLFHYSRQEDICVGTPIANRNRSDIENLIGFFVNTLVLRSEVSASFSFRELLRHVRETCLEAYTHQDVPFEKIVDVVQPDRDLSHTPLFQVMFVLQNNPVHSIGLPGLEFSSLEVENGISQFDLTLTLEEYENSLSGSFEFNTDLFELETIERMVVHFQNLLKGIAANPQKRISGYPILSDREQLDILVNWNTTSREYPLDKCLHQIFEDQVNKTPDSPAIATNDKTYTYRELNALANRLARYLQDSGVGPESLVGISIEKSAELLIGILAILKAGGAYVPLDPNYPRERLAYMVKDSRITVLITQAKAEAKFPNTYRKKIVLEKEWEKIMQQPDSNPAGNVCSDNTAYVIYTSGSTGQPKGVPVAHRSVINHNFAMKEIFNLEDADKVLQFATINFDAAVEEIFPTWFSGAMLIQPCNHNILSIDEFLNLIDKHKITVLDLPTSYWHEWVSTMTLGKMKMPDSLRLVVLGGDKALPERVGAWSKLGVDNLRLLNTYGPTEATIVSTFFETEKAESPGKHQPDIPIGKPIANTRVYILDSKLRPVPVGVPGELHIGGEGVARGYLNKPELTAEKFIPDPFSTTEGAVLYKTGDLVCHRPDGNIRFLGRVDSQVKIRGYRIEIGEIEDALSQYPGVREVAVNPFEDESGTKRLAAYCVPNFSYNPDETDRRRHLRVPFSSEIEIRMAENKIIQSKTENLSLGGLSMILNSSSWNGNEHLQLRLNMSDLSRIIELKGKVTWHHKNRIGVRFNHLSVRQQKMVEEVFDYLLKDNEVLINEIRGFLLAKLPDYLIPSYFMLLDKLPKTPSGKINRKALPAPKKKERTGNGEFVRAEKPVEKILAEIWKDVLKIDKIDIRDNFFELGGDSILSIQVIARAKNAGINLTPMQIFQYQTIEKIAAVVNTSRRAKTEQGILTGEVPLTPIQHWFFDQNYSQPHHWNQTIMLTVKALPDPSVFREVTKYILDRHDALRLRYQQDGKRWKQYYTAAEDDLPFSFIDLSNKTSEEQSAEIEEKAGAAQSSLNFMEGPVIRMVYFHLGKNKPGRLLTVIHHLVVDGVSWRILMDDIQTILQQLLQNKRVQLAEKSSSYRQWAQGLSDYANSEEIQKEAEYWKRLTREKIEPLPIDIPGEKNLEEFTETLNISLSGEETSSLLQEVPSAYSTHINEVLLTALVRAFSRWTGRRKLLVEMEGHGREELFDDLDISRTIGWFTTIFPVLLDLRNTINAVDSLKIVKEQVRSIPKRGIGYGLLRYLSADPVIRREMQNLPAPGVSFNYLGQIDQVLEADAFFSPATESAGPDRHSENHRGNNIDISAVVSHHQLRLTIMYGSRLYFRETMERLANDFFSELREIIKSCKAPSTPAYTSSDFPLANLDQEKLDRILGKLNRKK